ncbi:MAG: hypothetical protein H7Y38_10765 [Armatimonadetes bacterium]|nr:hypothetical protein [Armatimonadota bacterium]
MYTIVFAGANVSGYFLTVWLREALGMYGALQTAIRTAGSTPTIVADSPVATVASPLSAYKPLTPNAEPKIMRVGAGTGANP